MIKIMSKTFVDLLLSRGDPRQTQAPSGYLFHQGDPVQAVFVVETGLIELTRHLPDGTSIILQRAQSRTVLAEASVYSDTYHCSALIAEPTVAWHWPKHTFAQYIKDDEAFAAMWAAHLAREVQSARYRSEILSRKTVADRLDGWLVWQGNALPPKGQWKAVAAQIGVSPEALYRELAKRRSV